MTAAEISRQELAICPPCEAELHDTCFGGKCLCACVDLTDTERIIRLADSIGAHP